MSENKNGGIGFVGLLQVALILAKVCNWTAISWWWVLSPTIGAIVIVLAIIVIVFLAAIIKAVVS